MLRPYDLFENILREIENGIREGINTEILAEKYPLSESYLRKLFKFAFKQSIAGYIRSRKLSASLDELLKTNLNIIDIALNYGFDYEQSYIRTFKREFGITPGDLRKTGAIVKVTPPLHLFNAKKALDGVFFGPDIVMVPKFYVIGKRHRLPSWELAVKTAPLSMDFWDNERKSIKTSKNLDGIYISLVRNWKCGKGIADFLTSVPVNNLDNIPEGLSGDTFESSLCARFRYIGKHHYFDLNEERIQPLSDAISKFRNDDLEKYELSNENIYFEKIDSRQYDGNYYQMEWFTPVVEKV